MLDIGIAELATKGAPDRFDGLGRGRFIERVGTYDPRRPELRLDMSKVDHWIKRGALPTPTVALLLKQQRIASAATAAAAA